MIFVLDVRNEIDALRRQKDDIDTTIAELETFLTTLGSPNQGSKT